MKMNENDFVTQKEKWWKLCLLVDAAAKVEEEDHRRVAEKQEVYNKYLETLGLFDNIPRKIRSSLVKRSDTQQNLSKVSTSSSSLNLFPQNPSSEPMVYDEEKRSKKGKSKMVCEDDEEEVRDERRLFEKNLKKFVTSKRRYTQQNYENLNGGSTSSSFLKRRCFDSSLHYESEKKEMKEPPDPNYQSSSPSSCVTENTNRKRRAVSQKKSSGKFKKAEVVPLPPRVTETPEWVLRVMKEMNSDDVIPRLIVERILTPSDVNPGQSRLSIPLTRLIRNDFLTRAEVRAIENIGVGTILVNQWSGMWELRSKIWAMKKKSGKGTLNYILNRGWNDVVQDNDLKVDDKISLWTFRCRGVLCFALDTVPV